ncbi:MAG: putative Ig domain-containing protein [Candidatus Hydrogenedentes bacterium]|nr:putative Ig domain-containing protein [Candidatus Hydrogenedentota bacterium]
MRQTFTGLLCLFLVTMAGAFGSARAATGEERPILTPRPPDSPRINGARVCGVRPGSPFLFRIPATGIRPMTFSADGLPDGLALDANAGIISGRIASTEKATYSITLHAKNGHGEASRGFRIVVGDTLALTPPMGWNHWYAHYNRITDAMMREAADIMVSSGMADVGYQYVNIDDCWMNAPQGDDPKRVGPLRDASGNIVPNAYFPDMRALTGYIHAKGLKAGIYTSPGPLTCGGYAGSYEHEAQDAKQFAEWGFDFLKYDWCSYDRVAKDKSLAELKKPYQMMSAHLREQNRDIVFNLCQYGMGGVWTWGEEVGGNCWRTAGDLGFELTQYHDVAVRNAAHAPYARPGAWNDPDYIQIGFVGDARKLGEPAPCPLSAHEQYSYMSLWCLMAAPLFYSGDMTRLDAFTLNVLCNPEVIDVDQDPLGKQGALAVSGRGWEIWKKELEDGSCAVGLFNRGEETQTITAAWGDIHVNGEQRVRDLWRQQDVETRTGSIAAEVPTRGVALLRLTPVR